MGSSRLDTLLLDFGLCGRFPLGFWILLQIVNVYQCFLFMGNSLAAYKPAFKCRADVGVDVTNLSMKEICDLGCPNDDWIYRSSTNESLYSNVSPSSSTSLSAEWGLVCDREIYSNVLEMLFFLGSLFGTSFSGHLADKYGRRPSTLAFACAAVVFGVNIFWVPDVISYGVIRFILGAAFVGMFGAVSLKLEMFCARKRFIPATCDLGWTYGSLILPLIVYLLPESVPWLIKYKRHDEAFAILKSIADSRGKEFSRNEYDEMVEEDDKEEEEDDKEEDEIRQRNKELDDAAPEKGENNKYYNDNDDNNDATSQLETQIPSTQPSVDSDFLQALKCRHFLWTLICSSVFWSYGNVVDIGLTFSYGTLAGNRLINFLLIVIISIPARIIAIPIVVWVKRRPSIFASLMLTSACFLASAIVRGSNANYETDYANLRKGLMMTAKFCVSIFFECFWLWQQEPVPTLLRGRSFQFACCVARVVSVLACFSSFLQTRYPLVLESSLGIVGMLVALMTLTIPETFNEPLPQSMAHFKQLKKKTKLSLW